MRKYTYDDAIRERYGPLEVYEREAARPVPKRAPPPPPRVCAVELLPPPPVRRPRKLPPPRGASPYCPACGRGADVCFDHGRFWKPPELRALDPTRRGRKVRG